MKKEVFGGTLLYMNTGNDLFSGEYYHVYNRGNSKQAIFLDEQDYNYFLKVLYIGNSKKRIVNSGRVSDFYLYERGGALISIGAYCLMPNHFHILIKTKDRELLSLFMKKICTSYVMYFNKKYKRTGGLFEGKYKSTHVYEDRYFQYLFAYIHLNPAKLLDPLWKEKMKVIPEEMLSYINNYKYSSYSDYLSLPKRYYSVILEKGDFPFVFVENNPEKSIVQWILQG